MNNSLKNILLWGGVILGLILVFYFYQYYKQDAGILDRLSGLAKIGDLDRTIVEEEKVLKDSSLDPNDALLVNHLLAQSLWWRNQGGDRERSVKIFNQFITDEKLFPAERSMMALNLAAFLEGQFDDKFQKNFVFNDGKFKEFIGEAGNVRVAIHNLLDFANNLHESSFSKIMLAEAKTWLLIEKDKESEAVTYLKDAENLVDDAVQLFESEAKNANLDTLTLADHHGRIGSVYGGLSVLKKEDGLFSLAEGQFEKAIELAKEVQAKDVWNKEYAKSYEATARLRYAQVLVGEYGEKKSVEIRNILAPIIDLPQTQFTKVFFDHISALGAYGKQNPDSAIYKITLSLASIDPAFQDFLKKNGW